MKTEIVPGYLDFTDIILLCPYCGLTHRHGKSVAGSRLSHCKANQRIYEIRLLVGSMPKILFYLERRIKSLDHRYFTRRIRPDIYLRDRQQLFTCIRALHAGLLAQEKESVFIFSNVIKKAAL